MNDEIKAAFLETIYFQKRNSLLTLAMKHIRDYARAEELVQDTFVSAQLNIDKLMQSPNPGGWLYKTLMFKIKHEREAHQKYVKMQMELSQKLATEAQTAEYENDDIKFFDRLTEDEQKLLSLVYIDGYTDAEAADILDITYDAFRKRLHRARTKILQKDEEEFV